MNESYCNNCGKKGHLYNQCKMPITSIGVVAFRFFNNELHLFQWASTWKDGTISQR